MEIVDEEGAWHVDLAPMSTYQDQPSPSYMRVIYFTNRKTGEVLKGYCTSLGAPFDNEIRAAFQTAKRYRDQQAGEM